MANTYRPSPRRPNPNRRAQYRRRRLGVLAGILSLVVVVYLLIPSGGSSPKRRTSANVGHGASVKSGLPPAVEAGVLPWTLSAALAREAVLPGGGSSLLVAGGLNAAQKSLTSVVSIDVTTGNKTIDGSLASAVHDSAAAVIGGQVHLFGGGSPTTVATLQQFSAPPGTGTQAPPPASWLPPAAGTPASPSNLGVNATSPVVITGATTTSTAPSPVAGTTTGALPRPRSDLSAVTVGGTTYIVGGYDGQGPDSEIWSTTDGTHFSVAGHLQVPVRYAAVAVSGGKVYAFGGEGVGGAQDGSAVASVQVFDPANGHTALSGSLPQPVAGASAFLLGGHLYLAGGVGNAAPATGATPAKLGDTATDAIWAWDTSAGRALSAGKLPVPIAYGGSAVTYGRGWIVGGENHGQAQTTVQAIWPNPSFGTAGAPGAGSPYFGYKLLVADRGNNRLLLMSPGDQIGWTYPSATAPAPPGGFYFPDDAFFAKNGTEIVSNQEENHTIVILGYPSGQVVWQYGHPLKAGSSSGYLNMPDDAYVLKDGEVTVADDLNCRVLFINQDKTVSGQIGSPGSCTHKPPTGIAKPNGDTPLSDGNYLVSEITGQWISEYTKAGQLVWTTHLNMHYPSDPQELGPDIYLVSDYAQFPGGAIDVFNREGQILYRLQPAKGITRMNQPSLTEFLPSGVFMTNDDYRDRMIAFDPPTGALVWQYGTPDVPGTGPGTLNTPDGFDLLAPDGSTPTHTATG